MWKAHTLWPGHIKTFCPISNIPSQRNLVSCLLWLRCTGFTYRTVALYSMSTVDLCIALKFHTWLISEWHPLSDSFHAQVLTPIPRLQCRRTGQPVLPGYFQCLENLYILNLFAPLQTLPACPRISFPVPENTVHPAWTYHDFHHGILSSVCNAWNGTGQWFFYMGAGSRQGTPWHQNQSGPPESLCGGRVVLRQTTTWLIRHTSAIGPNKTEKLTNKLKTRLFFTVYYIYIGLHHVTCSIILS